MLRNDQIERFVHEGYVKIEAAFPREVAEEARAILWRDMGCREDDPETWTRPVVRLGIYGQPPFERAANAPVLHEAFDQLAGAGRWSPRRDLGTFPVRFPSRDDPGDTGWHIDTSFAPETGDRSGSGDYFDWRVNARSKGRALLMLFLFSDVGERDAPTVLRAGSHLDMARRLWPGAEKGFSLRELAANGFAESSYRPEVAATGEAGTVYLCHPFLVHAAQAHRGSRPRFLAQPALPAGPEPFVLEKAGGEYSPVERAIRMGLRLGGFDSLGKLDGSADG